MVSRSAMPDSQTELSNLPSLKTPLVRSLQRWRWVILIAGPIITATFELLEGHSLLDKALWLEIGLYSLLAPGLAWLLLTRLAFDLERRITQEAKQATELEARQRLTHQLAQHQEWDELVRFLVEFPNTTADVENTALFIYDVRQSQLNRVAEWNQLEGARVLSAQTAERERPCYTCQLPRLRHTTRCEHQADVAEWRELEAVCIPLAYDGVLVGLLRFGCRTTATISEDKRAWFDDTAPEIALALVRLIAVPERLAQARTDAQTYERRHIARTLHNSLAQQIGFLHLSLDRLAGNDRLIESDSLRGELGHMRDVASEAYTRVRDTLSFLQSQEQADLIQAIKTYAQNVVDKTGLKIEFTIHGEALPLTPEIGSRVFGLVQEGLNNIEKHAQAGHVHITLTWLADGLTLGIRDDGVGFDLAAPSPDGHYGLAMMRESVEELGGALSVEGGTGLGVSLRFSIPLTGAPQE
jgi:signal transduction histidine kinase